VKRDPIPYFFQVEGKEQAGGLEFYYGVEPGYWVDELWRLESQEG
jgi:hypothetical protein